MAKLFKDFDKKYRHLAGTALKTIGDLEKVDVKLELHDRWELFDHWPHASNFDESYAQGNVAYAVYQAEDADEWQKFRVSLKGLSTYEKMFALAWYWDKYVEPGAGTYLNKYTWFHHVIRVNNYLGALKRSGHLNHELRVVKS